MDFTKKERDYELVQERNAEWLRAQAIQEGYEKLQAQIDTLLDNFEDLEYDLQKLKNVKELSTWIADLELDSDLETKATYLTDAYDDMKQALNGLLSILYDLKKEI